MDYVVGSVAALISGNVTPNRPKIVKRALTPMKHQPSPNVTPKSELVSDRSIFLSPTAQKKKAIVKKSPKRIFQNPDLDETNENEGNISLVSPQADKVKKHLKDDLDANMDKGSNILSPKSPKNKNSNTEEPLSPKKSPKKKLSLENNVETQQLIQVSNERTPKKKKRKHSLSNEITSNDNSEKVSCDTNMEGDILEKAPKKLNKAGKLVIEEMDTNAESHDTKTLQQESGIQAVEKVSKNKKWKKKSKKPVIETVEKNSQENDTNTQSPSGNKENEEQKKKKKNRKQKKNLSKNLLTDTELSKMDVDSNETNKSEISNEAPFINPNAITSQDTDSEHESDDEIASENEESNKAILDTGPVASSDDEEEEKDTKDKKKADKEETKERVETEEEVKRTLFVGNVPFSSKCKKEVKRIFSKYGDIETVRIRTVPVKDARVTPKLAIIKNELHPDRSTVNVYIKYKHPSSVNDALAENNTVLNDHHLRVARSDVTGSEHDPKCSVFVGNIPFALEDEGLRAKFEKCGQIDSVRIIRDRKTNAGKGFGYVNFASKDGVELALALTEEDLTIKNRILRVKRCSQATTPKDKQHNQGRHSNQGKQNYQSRFNQRPNQRNDRNQMNRFGKPFGNDRFQRGQQDEDSKRNQMNRFGKSFGNDRFQRGQQDEDSKRNQMNRFGKSFGNDRFQRGQQDEDSKGEGAYRRIMNKRKPQDNNDGPPNKRQKNLNQPNKEKKTRKEFVGMTAEKKKFQKKKLNKDQKKKKAFSEILTKPRQ